MDGRVLSGHSFVEQAAITGEPMPSEKRAGSDVYAGTINQAGTLQVRAERLGKETTFGKIIEAVENAERHGPRYRRQQHGLPATWSTSPWAPLCLPF